MKSPYSKIEKIALERLRFQVQQAVCLDGVDLTPDVSLDMMAGCLVMRLRADLLGRKVKEEVKDEVVARVPTDWWQAFRARFFPAWWLEMYPVRMRDIYASVLRQRFHLCQHLKTDKSQTHVHFMASEPLRWWEEENQ